MNTEKLISLIDKALLKIDNFSNESREYFDEEEFEDTIKVLKLLKNEILNNPNQINNRVLRAMHDIGAITIREFEGTFLEAAIFNLIKVIVKEIPSYKKLEPLRMDFGKGNPI